MNRPGSAAFQLAPLGCLMLSLLSMTAALFVDMQPYPDIYDKWAWPETYMHPSVLPLMQAACFFAALALAIRISRLLFEWDVEC